MSYNEYDLKTFGKKLKQLRKNLNLTQIQVSNLASISTDTYSEAERGKRLLSIPTYNQISQVFKYDLIILLSTQYKYEHSKEIKTFEKMMNSISYEGNKYTVEQLKEDMTVYLETSKDYIPFTVFIKLSQLIILTDTIKIINKSDLSTIYCLEDLCLKGLKLTSPDFNSYQFSISENLLRTEIRLIINLSIAKFHQEEIELAFNILENLIESVKLKLEFDPSLYQLLQQAYCNYNKFYFHLNSYDDCVKICNLGIELDKFTQNVSILRLLYFSKGISQYFLHDMEFSLTIERSFELTDKKKDTVIYEELVEALFKHCGMTLNEITIINSKKKKSQIK